MPYMIVERDDQFCVYKHDAEGNAVGETFGCHDTREKAEAQMRAILANTHEPAAKAGNMEGLTEHLVKKYGDDPGFFTKCMEAEELADYNEEQRAGICAVAHRQATGIWPGEHRGEKSPSKGFSQKAGRRHSATDLALLREIKVHAGEIGRKADELGAAAEEVEEVLQGGSPQKAADLSCLKSLGGNRLGGYAVLWGSPSQKDITGEYFTPDTAEMLSIFKAMGRLPWLYHHAMDDTVKAEVVGFVDVLEADDLGLWYETQLAKATKYREVVKRLADAGALGTSSSTLPGARKVASDGRILRWPIVEISGTPTPAEPRLMERPLAEIKAAFGAIGLSFVSAGSEDKGAEEARQRAIERERELIALTELAAE